MKPSHWYFIASLLAFGTLLAFVTRFPELTSEEINPSSVKGFNYTDDYIDQFHIANDGQRLSGGGPNIFPREAGEERSGGGKSMCCIGIPRRWRPGMKLIVKWKADKVQDGKTPSKWYTATTDVPPYKPRTFGFWVHFLPGDRIRVQIQDTPAIPGKPEARDSYIVQGALDPALNSPESPR